jgi:hypothetical protein
MMYRIEESKVVFYEEEAMKVREPSVGSGHHPIEFGFKEVDEIFDYQDAELIKAFKEQDGSVYHIIQGRDRTELLDFVNKDDGMTVVYSEKKPTFTVFKMPEVGDKVSFGFNGDWYACGEIAKISKTFKKIATNTGEIFWRNGKGKSWMREGGTWSMTKGHYNERNPHF